MNLEQALGLMVVVVVGVIGYFLKGLISKQERDVETSRRNERELYSKIAQVELTYWKDQCEQARRTK
jgi:hypothetical protein